MAIPSSGLILITMTRLQPAVALAQEQPRLTTNLMSVVRGSRPFPLLSSDGARLYYLLDSMIALRLEFANDTESALSTASAGRDVRAGDQSQGCEGTRPSIPQSLLLRADEVIQ
jgi:hypothetical protein